MNISEELKMKRLVMEVNRLELLAEDLESAHMALDDLGIPRAGQQGITFSLVGRIKIAINKGHVIVKE